MALSSRKYGPAGFEARLLTARSRTPQPPSPNSEEWPRRDIPPSLSLSPLSEGAYIATEVTPSTCRPGCYKLRQWTTYCDNINHPRLHPSVFNTRCKTGYSSQTPTPISQAQGVRHQDPTPFRARCNLFTSHNRGAHRDRLGRFDNGLYQRFSFPLPDNLDDGAGDTTTSPLLRARKYPVMNDDGDGNNTTRSA